MKIYIYVKEKFETKTGSHFFIESILNTYYKVTEKITQRFKIKNIEEALESYKLLISEKGLKEIYKKEREKENIKIESTLEKIELVAVKTTPYIKGVYFAHEYGKKVEGKGRKRIYSNGHIEYEIKCLDKELMVLDGIWNEYDNNGCGDKFFADKEIK
jgi:hypothetical protein